LRWRRANRSKARVPTKAKRAAFPARPARGAKSPALRCPARPPSVRRQWPTESAAVAGRTSPINGDGGRGSAAKAVERLRDEKRLVSWRCRREKDVLQARIGVAIEARAEFIDRATISLLPPVKDQ